MNKSYKKILSLNFGCFISVASYAAAPLPFGAPFGAAAQAQRPSRQRFSLLEDQQLATLVEQHGENDWAQIASFMPGRSARQCRERWQNYLAPSLDSLPWTPKEDDLLLQKFREFGHKWGKIAESFPARSYLNCKNRWRTLQNHAPEAQQQQPMIPAMLPQQQQFSLDDDLVPQQQQFSLDNDLVQQQQQQQQQPNSFNFFGWVMSLLRPFWK
jgi:hypothetical protein